MNILHFSKISTLTKHMLLTFMVSFMFGASIAKAKVDKPAFTERFEKRRAYKHKGGNVMTSNRVQVKESKKPAFTERFEKKRANRPFGSCHYDDRTEPAEYEIDKKPTPGDGDPWHFR